MFNELLSSKFNISSSASASAIIGNQKSGNATINKLQMLLPLLEEVEQYNPLCIAPSLWSKDILKVNSGLLGFLKPLPNNKKTFWITVDVWNLGSLQFCRCNGPQPCQTALPPDKPENFTYTLKKRNHFKPTVTQGC